MRIEGIGIQKTSAQAAPGVSPRLEAGDVLTATVQKAEGDAVVLKTSDGKLLNARLTENATLAQNDKVEFLVAQSGKEGILLRIVYVEPQAESNAAPPAASAAEASLLEAFEQAGIRPDARTLASALGLMRQNGLTPKAALFFALNRMEATPGRLAAYRALTSGKGPGETLYEAAQALGELLGEPEAESAHQAQAPQAQNGDAAAPQTGESVPVLQGEAEAPAPGAARDTAADAAKPPAQARGEGEAARATGESTAQGAAHITGESTAQNAAHITGKNAAQSAARTDAAPQGTPDTDDAQNTQAARPGAPESGGTARAAKDFTAPAHGGAFPAQGDTDAPAAPTARGENTPIARAELPDPAARKGTADGPERVVPQARSEGVEAAVPQGGAVPEGAAKVAQNDNSAARAELKELPSRIFDIFLKLTGGEDAGDLKKFVSESNAKLEALKFMAEKYDGESMRTVQPRLEQAQAQAKLAQDVTRFVCFELPVHNGEYGTAELYVYRRAKGKGEIDADNASVLISIPTESFGRVETLLRTENGSLTAAFSVERQGGVDALKENMRELRKSLSARTPYRLGEMRVGPLRERTTVENAEAVLSGGARKNSASIDVKI